MFQILEMTIQGFGVSAGVCLPIQHDSLSPTFLFDFE
jgi:hypothetical protein